MQAQKCSCQEDQADLVSQAVVQTEKLDLLVELSLVHEEMDLLCTFLTRNNTSQSPTTQSRGSSIAERSTSVKSSAEERSHCEHLLVEVFMKNI